MTNPRGSQACKVSREQPKRVLKSPGECWSKRRWLVVVMLGGPPTSCVWLCSSSSVGALAERLLCAGASDPDLRPRGARASQRRAKASSPPAALSPCSPPATGSLPPQGADCRVPGPPARGGREEVLRVTHCLTAFPLLSVRCSSGGLGGRCSGLLFFALLTGRCSG